MVDILTSQIEDREPTPEERGVDPAASAMGRKGGPALAIQKARSFFRSLSFRQRHDFSLWQQLPADVACKLREGSGLQLGIRLKTLAGSGECKNRVIRLVNILST